MATAVETLPQSAIPSGPFPHEGFRASGTAGANPVLLPWVTAQATNLTRHAAALRPFRRDEFGTASAAPPAGHLEAVNPLLSSLPCGLVNLSKRGYSAPRP